MWPSEARLSAIQASNASAVLGRRVAVSGKAVAPQTTIVIVTGFGAKLQRGVHLEIHHPLK